MSFLVRSKYEGPQKISFLGIPKVGEKQWAEKEERERKSVLTMTR